MDVAEQLACLNDGIGRVLAAQEAVADVQERENIWKVDLLQPIKRRANRC